MNSIGLSFFHYNLSYPYGGVVKSGVYAACHAGGRGFESRRPRKEGQIAQSVEYLSEKQGSAVRFLWPQSFSFIKQNIVRYVVQIYIIYL